MVMRLGGLMTKNRNSIARFLPHWEVLQPIPGVYRLRICKLPGLFSSYCYTLWRWYKHVSSNNRGFPSNVWWSRKHLQFLIDCFRSFLFRRHLSWSSRNQNNSFPYVRVKRTGAEAPVESKVVRLTSFFTLKHIFQSHVIGFKQN